MFPNPTSRPVVLEHDADTLGSMAFVYCSRDVEYGKIKTNTAKSWITAVLVAVVTFMTCSLL